MKNTFDIAIIGGGAAGFFAAIHASDGGRLNVIILEKTSKILTKVGVSGGGRCNVTHDCPSPARLVKHYPRGGKFLKKAFEQFGPNDTRSWFERCGVILKTEPDGRVFPVTNDSKTIIDCLTREAEKCGVEIRPRAEVAAVAPKDSGGFSLEMKDGPPIICRKVVVTAGGFAKSEGYDFIRTLGIRIVPPIPSLFTFNVPDSDLKDLSGLSVPHGFVQIPGSKWKEDGPVLITHRGFSAPAVIKLSAWAAVDLHSRNHCFPILINWTGLGEEDVRGVIAGMRTDHPKKFTVSNPLFDISTRLWERLCAKAGIGPEIKYAELSSKAGNRLVEMLVRCPYDVRGKNTFKEEFVTCGGVDLKEIDLKRFESKKVPGLYFAGEILNVDGVTGGFNFQHAWTSGYLAGRDAAAQVV